MVEALRVWVQQSTLMPDGQVILQDQAGPPLVPPYATLRVNGISRPFPMDYRDSVSQPELDAGLDVVLTTTGHRNISVSVNVYTPGTTGGQNALALLQRACDTLENQSVTDSLNAVGFVVQEMSDIQNLSVLLETNFQGRAHVELTLGAAVFNGERTGYINEITGEGDFSDAPDGSSVVSIPFDFVPP